MKERVTTINTKKMFVASLKKLLKTKSLSKVTISELIQDCGVNHKTFYYHFANIYDLVRWMLEYELVDIINGYDLINNYEEAIMFVLNYAKENKQVLHCIVNDIGREQLRYYFYKDFTSTIQNYIEKAIKENNFTISEKCAFFITSCFTELLVNAVIDYLSETISITENELLTYLKTFTMPSILATLQEAHNFLL